VRCPFAKIHPDASRPRSIACQQKNSKLAGTRQECPNVSEKYGCALSRDRSVRTLRSIAIARPTRGRVFRCALLLNFFTDPGILTGSQETEETLRNNRLRLVRGNAKAAVNKKIDRERVSEKEHLSRCFFIANSQFGPPPDLQLSKNDFGKCGVTARVVQTLMRHTPICRHLRASISALPEAGITAPIAHLLRFPRPPCGRPLRACATALRKHAIRLMRCLAALTGSDLNAEIPASVDRSQTSIDR